MAGNSIGQIFRVTTFGESHGQTIGGIVDGVPPGIKLCVNDLQNELNKRRPGHSIYTTNRFELDKINILSGIFNGFTTGTSIGLSINNLGHHSIDYESIKNVYRPGHADYCYQKKYGIRDYRGGGRSSARETAIRVAAGSIAKKFLLEESGIKIRGFLSKMGDIQCTLKDWDQIHKNQFFCPDKSRVKELHKLIEFLKKKGDSIGAEITLIIDGLFAGLGEPVFNGLDADLSHALMSINAAKGVEIGDGFAVVNKLGSENRDEMNKFGFLSNHAGGIIGGISNGQPIIARIAFKPTSSITIPGKTIDLDGKETNISITGRHDPCVGIRSVPIVESMAAIVIMDHYLRNRAQCNKSRDY